MAGPADAAAGTAAPPGLQVDGDQIATFVDTLFRYADDGTFVSLRSFRDDADGVFERPLPVEIGAGGLGALVDAAAALAGRCAASATPVVFAAPVATFHTAGSAAEANLANGLVLAVEIDERSVSARHTIEGILGPATVAIASGGRWTDPETGEVEDKLHLYWRLTEPTRDPVDHALLKQARRLATALVGADASNVPIVHPMRWPGSWHRKAEPRLARIVHCGGTDIELTDALALLEEIAEAAQPARQAHGGHLHQDSAPLSPAVAMAAAERIPNADLPWDGWNRLGMAFHAATAGSEAGFAAFDHWSGKSGKYDAAATRARWEHYRRSPPARIGAGTLVHEARRVDPEFHRSNRGEASGEVIRRMSARTAFAAMPVRAGDTRPGLPMAGPGDNLAAVLAELEPSDTGNAKRLIAQFGEDLLFTTHAGWHVWDGRRFQRDDRRQVVMLAQETASAIFMECRHLGNPEDQKRRSRWAIDSQNKARVTGMIEMAVPHCAILPEKLDADPWLLNVENGTLDLRSGRLRPHARSDRLTKLAPVAFDPNAPCPEWERFLFAIFAGDLDLVAFVQRAIGYSLSGDTREHVLIIAHGIGSNGKTTLLETTAAILGDYAQQTPTETFMSKQGTGSIPNDVARLAGARFVSAVESESGRRLAEGLVKQVTGGDRMAGRFLYRELFEFQPSLKLWLATNHRPEIKGTDEGIWRRIRLIPFDVQFVDAGEAQAGQPVKDKGLPERLKKELPGILAWAVRGCLDWQRDGLREPAKVLQATAQYRADMDELADFLAERCLLGAALSVLAKDIYGAYRSWCDENGATDVGQHIFGRALQERGFQKQKAGVIVYRGLSLREGIRAAE